MLAESFKILFQCNESLSAEKHKRTEIVMKVGYYTVPKYNVLHMVVLSVILRFFLFLLLSFFYFFFGGGEGGGGRRRTGKDWGILSLLFAWGRAAV